MIETINILDGTLYHDKEFLPVTIANKLFEYLKANANWQQQTTGYGKQLPRLTAYYADPGKNYDYSGLTQVADPWNETLIALKTKIEAAVGRRPVYS